MAMKKNAGFTLVELMIAMIAGSFAIAGVYYLNGMSARTYAQQQAVSDAQMSLRSAMEQIRRDVARAGYLAAPATGYLPNCAGVIPGPNQAATDNTSQHFQAITIGRGGSLTYKPDDISSGADVTALLKTPASNRVSADDLTMFGNFATADAYLANPIGSTHSSIVLQPDTESFRRSFFTPKANGSAAVADYGLFAATFREGRMLRVEHGGRFFFRQIATGALWSAGQAPTIPLKTPLPATCVETTNWMAVAPVSRIHYGLESDQMPDFARLRADPTLPGSRRALLVRREELTDSSAPAAATGITPNGGAIKSLANGARVVLDYAVEFGLSAVVSTQAPTVNVRPTWEHAITTAKIEAANLDPRRFRSLIITIASRAAEVDPRLGAVGGTRRLPDTNFLGDPLLTFNVIDPNFPALTGLQTRVRTLRSEIFLHNL
jgi:prepilin-type N-terminal cleavage/methylation domain-containing protein